MNAKLQSEELDSLVLDGTIKNYEWIDDVPYGTHSLTITFNNNRKLYIEGYGCRSDQAELMFQLL